MGGDVERTPHVRTVVTALLSGSGSRWVGRSTLARVPREHFECRIEYARIDLGSETQNLKFTG
jgi:hypothetical protein